MIGWIVANTSSCGLRRMLSRFRHAIVSASDTGRGGSSRSWRWGAVVAVMRQLRRPRRDFFSGGRHSASVGSRPRGPVSARKTSSSVGSRSAIVIGAQVRRIEQPDDLDHHGCTVGDAARGMTWPSRVTAPMRASCSAATRTRSRRPEAQLDHGLAESRLELRPRCPRRSPIRDRSRRSGRRAGRPPPGTGS